MRKPIPYKTEKERKKLEPKKIVFVIIFEIIAIILSIVTTASLSLLFSINPYISAGISSLILIIVTIFFSKEILKNNKK